MVRASLLSTAIVTCSVIVAGCDSGTEPEADPIITALAAGAHPEIPPGLKVSCPVGPDTVQPSTTCPVLQWNGLTYWAFSHLDNRFSLTIAAYDSAGDLMMVWERAGARYMWQITLNTEANTVTFHGQDSQTITMTWAELRVTDGY
jgi:hypothetical protein